MEAQPVTTRELQLELQIWTEHKAMLQTRGQLLQAQSVLLQGEAEKTETNIKRLTELLTPKAATEPEPAAAAAEPAVAAA